ncbi:MAG TPA: hypothetical protein VNX68_16055 [Nitrosopumilaceae archaeon]|jgi:hypothetical protein|nr:hypothetical protein [Nitrosopumilaceae archaeon]
MSIRSNFPDRKRKRQDEAIERINRNIQSLDTIIATKPENLVELKDRKQRLIDTVESTKKNRR